MVISITAFVTSGRAQEPAILPAPKQIEIKSASWAVDADAGRRLFAINCAHCHGDDATGDECPNLHGLQKSDERIARLITQGIKGEMPSFRKKLDNAQVATLIAFLRTLRDG